MAEWDDRVVLAVVAGLRTVADRLEQALRAPRGVEGSVPAAGSARSMEAVLRGVADINDRLERGANDEEMRAIAAQAGMDPRGMAGYYAPGARLLEKKEDGRWITEVGRERLGRLAGS
jgi:hypothetical protein